jgi:hypothetical protein
VHGIDATTWIISRQVDFTRRERALHSADHTCGSCALRYREVFLFNGARRDAHGSRAPGVRHVTHAGDGSARGPSKPSSAAMTQLQRRCSLPATAGPSRPTPARGRDRHDGPRT